MTTFLSAAVVICFAALTSAASWDGLRVHFGINPLSSKNFVAMPRHVSEIQGGAFVEDKPCSADNGFFGRRFVSKDGDRSVMLLFDARGSIAGIQTKIPKSTGFPSEAAKKFHDVYLEEGDSHVITAYFVDPSKICTTGRTQDQVKSEGTGNTLRFQVGRATSSGVRTKYIPVKESDMPSTSWTKGKCFFFMGMHYWYNLRDDMDCADFFPGFALYRKGQMVGFGFAMTANYDGKYYEHPTVSVANKFFPFIPKCMKAPGFPQTFTTVHVYFVNKPWWINCWF